MGNKFTFASIMKDTLYSVFANKCPRCHKSDFFVNKHFWQIKGFDKMHKSCSHCKQDFEKETGFYYGAMYTAYLITVMYSLGLTAMIVWILKWMDIPQFFYVLFPSMLILMPWFYRASRLLWINFFVRFDSKL